MNKTKFNILLVDDDYMSLNSLDSFLSSEGYNIDSFLSSLEALESLKGKKHSILLTDFMMPHMTGLQLIKTCKKIQPNLITILFTGYCTEPLKAQIEHNSSLVNYFIQKPIKIEKLINIIDQEILSSKQEEK